MPDQSDSKEQPKPSDESPLSAKGAGSEEPLSPPVVAEQPKPESHSESPTAPKANPPAADLKHIAEKLASQQKIEIQRAESEEITFINNQQNIKNFFTGEQKFSVRMLSASMTHSISLGAEQVAARDILIDSQVQEELISCLRSHRVLVLRGEPESGKYTLAVALSHLLRSRDAAVCKEAAVVTPLDAGVRVNVIDLCSADESFSGRVVLFRDALVRSNRDLQEFLASLDASTIPSLTAKLAQVGVYIILTTDAHSIDRLIERPASLPIVKSVPQPSKATMLRAFDRFVVDVGGGQTVEDAMRQEVIGHATTVSSVLRFVREYWPLVREGKITVSASFQRIDDVHRWLLDHVADECDPWLSTVLLGLAQSTSAAEGLPWTEFERLRAVLAPAIYAIVGMPENNERYRKDRVSEDALLKGMRATVERDPHMGRDVIRFIDERYAARIWATLLNHCRSLLLGIVPALREMVLNEEVTLRARAGQILGRIAEIDPVAVAVPFLLDVGQAQSKTTRAACGYFFQGALSSRDVQYREFALSFLREMSLSRSWDEVWTAIAIYKQIGVLDLSLCMVGLRAIAEKDLTDKLVDLQKLQRVIRAVETEARNDVDHGAEMTELSRVLRRLSQRLFADQMKVLLALQYALVSLCITLNPIDLFKELRIWMKGSDGLRALSALIFLQTNGIAEELNGYSSVMPTCTPNAIENATPIIVALATGSEQSQATFSLFLEDVFGSFYYFFPQEVARYLREAFFEYLWLWIEGSISVPQARECMELVVVRLLTSANRDLVTHCHQLLTSDGRIVHGSTEVQDFARTVLKKALTSSSGRTTQATNPFRRKEDSPQPEG